MVEQIIMRSDPTALNNFDFDHIKPTSGKSFREQVVSCIEQLSDFITHEEKRKYFITQQSFFISARTRAEYHERSTLIRELLKTMCGANLPATSIVSQSPASSCDVVLELICTRVSEEKKVIYKSCDDIGYTVVEYPGFKSVHCAGLMGDPDDSVHDSSVKAFEKALSILSQEGLQIHHIVRQWNYIEQIAQVPKTNGKQQNYQIFNDVRAHYYMKGDFRNGYPAATGIGMDTGGVIVDFMALSESEQVRIHPIANPGQIDAHRYSEQVLEGPSAGKCTPKFERAKMVVIDGIHYYFYVSGTASILGERTMHIEDVEKQTSTTIDNIENLFSAENQESMGVRFDMGDVRFSHLRVYVKRMEDVPAVRRVCESRLRCNSILYLESDVCREELLVEIEGVFTV